MKNTLLAITFIAVTAFAAGCKPAQENSTAQQLDKVKTETKADAQEMKDYAFAQKAEFVATMQGQLDALNKDLDHSPPKLTNPAMRSRPTPNPNSKPCATKRPK